MNDTAAEAPAKVELPALPAVTLKDALIHLRRPFTAHAVKWKIQASGPKGGATWAIAVAYIDARLVMERLNMVVPGEWAEKPIRVEGHPEALMYELTVFDRAHVDVGVGQGSTEGMKLKGMHSDALKRVAVRFGVGVSLYAMPQLFLKVTPQEEVVDEGEPTLLRLNDGKPGRLKDKHEKWLNSRYQAWLDAEGIAHFGDPLDHGDARTGSTGALADLPPVEEDGSEDAADVPPEPLTDEKANALRGRIEHAYAELCEINPDRLAQGRVEKMLRDGGHSHDELEKAAAAIERLVETEQVLAERRGELVDLLGATKAKPLIDSAERRGSQDERIESLDRAIATAKENDANAG